MKQASLQADGFRDDEFPTFVVTPTVLESFLDPSNYKIYRLRKKSHQYDGKSPKWF